MNNDASNLDALCASHHATKTNLIDKRRLRTAEDPTGTLSPPANSVDDESGPRVS
jgi:hypothetical protein